MSNPNFALTYTATAAVGAYRIVKPGTNDGEAILATASTEKLLGVNDSITVASGDKFDVFTQGKAKVVLGGTVAAGDWLTSDANAAAVTAAPATGVNAECIGKAQISGSAGDVIPVILNFARIQG